MCTCVLGKGHVGTARAADVTGADDDSVIQLSWRIEPPRVSPSETTPHWLQLGSEAFFTSGPGSWAAARRSTSARDVGQFLSHSYSAQSVPEAAAPGERTAVGPRTPRAPPSARPMGIFERVHARASRMRPLAPMNDREPRGAG